ncbi:hypothetical protein GCM10010232_43480 [Streptomyces amakusaensis]|uniref:Transposase n=1 Tax=Streptomyces amakusaensis TaxID=67271 RepID=A0ABW0ATU7_9ACTN
MNPMENEHIQHDIRRPRKDRRPDSTMPGRRRPRPMPQPATAGHHCQPWKPVRPTAQRVHEIELLAEFE